MPSFDFSVEIIVGQEDYATPIAMAEAMALVIPSAKMEILGGVRHFTPLEVPNKIATAIRRLG
ncbi:hypothetical protein [uncultured Boseongicola sp.]|uniref:alpha/beta fold hydrolase n=1 Tax=uncultured Boseongicola sp. TaxID=1648499 RepID=UPI0026017D7E|nr:hypothetical protein [uncultured Boseongicola sp.]